MQSKNVHVFRTAAATRRRGHRERAPACAAGARAACGQFAADAGRAGAGARDADRRRDRIRRDAQVAAARRPSSRRVDGQITQIFVKSGDRVRQGAPLVQIDPRRQQAAVSSQEAERAAREAARRATRASRRSARTSCYAAGAISKQELEQADTALRTAEAQPQGAAGAGAAAAGAAALLHRHRADRRHRRRRAGARRQSGDDADRC